jgi:Zn-dependent protease
MLQSWRIGRFLGIKVFIHWSFLLVPALALFESYHKGWQTALFAVLLVLAAFACVLLHEFGHALTARLYGIRTRDITLYPIGGVARLEGMGRRPVEEVFIALGGPAVNVAIAFLLAVGIALLDGTGLLTFEDRDAFVPRFLVYLLTANVFLAFFNLLPAFPMDGGRVLRALLATRLSRLRATEIAAGIGIAFALLIALLPIPMFFWSRAYHPEEPAFTPMPLFVGLFVILAGQRELAAIRQAERQRKEEEILEALPVEDAEQSVVDSEPSRNGTAHR